jgi:G3E family GTPase
VSKVFVFYQATKGDSHHHHHDHHDHHHHDHHDHHHDVEVKEEKVAPIDATSEMDTVYIKEEFSSSKENRNLASLPLEKTITRFLELQFGAENVAFNSLANNFMWKVNVDTSEATVTIPWDGSTWV